MGSIGAWERTDPAMDRSAQLDDFTGAVPAQVHGVPVQRAGKGLAARIAKELMTLRQGYGLFARRIDLLVGPALREMCNVDVTDDPGDIRWKVEVRLRDLATGLREDLRTALFGALAIHPDTRRLTYQERVRWVSRRIERDERTSRRRMDEAVNHLARLAARPVHGRRPAVHRTILVVDVEQFCDRRRRNVNQVAVRRGLYRSLYSAFETADIPWESCDREDRGDGVFILAAGDVPKAAFIEALPLALVDALRRHNNTHPDTERIRLRMAVHAGEVSYDDHGVTAASVNLAFRLLDAPALRSALVGSPGVLALIVSSWFFEEVVWQSSAEDAATYRHTVVVAKETTASAWIALPDHPYPPDDGATPNRRHVPLTLVPRQLPSWPRSFTGRAAELDALSTEGAGLTAAIVGMGGIGKTWLALHWAYLNADQFPDGQLYVNLRGFDPSGTPVEPAVAVRGFLDSLGLSPDLIPSDPATQVALYRSVVADKRMLILLDNARDSSQIIPLLPGSMSCTVLVTSRNHLTGLVATHGARPLTLTMLSDIEARELLAKRLGGQRVEAEPRAVAKLVGYCAGLPLALGIVAAHAATHADFSLASLATELGETSARLDALDGGELTANLRAALSWSYQALEPEAAAVFALLSLAPGPDIGLPAASVLTGLPAGRFTVMVRQLTNAHLVQRHGSTRYRMHDLVRLYATEHAAGVGTAALRRLISFYVQASYVGERLLYPDRKPIEIERPTHEEIPAFADDASILTWFDVELPCLLAAQKTASQHGWHSFVWQLAWTLHGYLWRRGHLRAQLATWDAGLAAATELGDPAVQGVAHRLLGQAFTRAGMLTKASGHLRQALDLARQSGDRHGEARAHHDLTWVWRHRDDQLALDHASEALRLFRTIGNPVWEAEALNMMGWHQAQLGQYHQARASCERALLLFGRHLNRQGQALALDCLGCIAYHSGEHELALSWFGESLELFCDLGARYHEADVLDHLGLAHAALGNKPQARQAWQRALALNNSQHRTADAQRVQRHISDLTCLHQPCESEKAC
jgi:tetratricopeptide (TPR) repeat protein